MSPPMVEEIVRMAKYFSIYMLICECCIQIYSINKIDLYCIYCLICIIFKKKTKYHMHKKKIIARKTKFVDRQL